MFYEYAEQYQPPFHPFSIGPSVANRTAWENLNPDLAKRLLCEGLRAQASPWSVIYATDYLDFARTGNRIHFEDKQFSRRQKLNDLIFAECIQHQGHFLDDIINGIYMICEESAWQLPPHNTYIKDTPQLPLPDTTRPVVDLFAAETGAVLASAVYLMKDSLDPVSPFIAETVKETLIKRIFTPYLHEYFWWMGDGTAHVNNWTVWCTQNVLIAAALTPIEESMRQQIFLKACKSIDYFLDEYGEDGCCDEGAHYYRHAGLCLFGCMEILNGMTGGHFAPLYQHEKIKNIASYVLNMHVNDHWYINFADCSAVTVRCSAREYLFGKRTGNANLMKLSAQDLKVNEDALLLDEHNTWYRLLQFSYWDEMMAYPTDGPIFHPELYYPSAGVFLTRDDTFCLAVKAGDNDDSHNHNDCGSFTLYKDGLPFFTDIGVETYCRKTFSPQRYKLWTMQSQYHNLPTFTGCEKTACASTPYALAADFAGQSGLYGIMENDGPQYAAHHVKWQIGESFSEISMELADAYPDTRVQSFVRHASFDKPQETITITDHYSCDGLTPVLSLITYEVPTWDPEKQILHVGDLGDCQIPNASKVIIECLPITDARLQLAWKADLWRILVTPEKDDLTLIITK